MSLIYSCLSLSLSLVVENDEDIENVKSCDYMLTIVQQDDNWVD